MYVSLLRRLLMAAAVGIAGLVLFARPLDASTTRAPWVDFAVIPVPSLRIEDGVAHEDGEDGDNLGSPKTKKGKAVPAPQPPGPNVPAPETLIQMSQQQRDKYMKRQISKMDESMQPYQRAGEAFSSVAKEVRAHRYKTQDAVSKAISERVATQ